MRPCHSLLLVLSTVAAGSVAAQGSLCTLKEKVVWTCPAPNKTYSLCASRDLGAKAGYLQYRAGPPGHAQFLFPPKLLHPKGRFQYSNHSRFARLTFDGGAYSYEIEEELVGPTRVRVTKGDTLVSEFECARASRTLMNSDVIEILSVAGAVSQ
jgi:hypothetical protein